MHIELMESIHFHFKFFAKVFCFDLAAMIKNAARLHIISISVAVLTNFSPLPFSPSFPLSFSLSLGVSRINIREMSHENLLLASLLPQSLLVFSFSCVIQVLQQHLNAFLLCLSASSRSCEDLT